MRKFGYMLACCLVVGSLQTLSASVDLAGCGCQNRQKKQTKEANPQEKASILLAGCGCQNKTRPKPALPVKPQEKASVMLAAAGGCGCGKKKQKAQKQERDTTTVTLAGCGCNKRPDIKPLPPKKEQALYSKMAVMAEQNRVLIAGIDGPSSPLSFHLASRDCCNFQKSAKFAPTTHVAKEIDPAGSMVSIEDGSAFTIAEKAQGSVKSWKLNSLITVKPNKLSLWNKLTGSKPQFKYQIVNLSNNKTAQANLALGPFLTSPLARKIQQLDVENGEVYLSNGTVWRVDLSGPCAELFSHWSKDHYIIVGSNDTWFSFGSKYILIDVETDNWLPATRLQ